MRVIDSRRRVIKLHGELVAAAASRKEIRELPYIYNSSGRALCLITSSAAVQCARCVPGASRGGAARAQPPLRAEGHILGAISPLLCLACVSIIFYFLHTRQQSVTVF